MPVLSARTHRTLVAATAAAMMCAGVASVGASPADAAAGKPGGRLTAGGTTLSPRLGDTDRASGALPQGVPRSGRFTFLLQLDAAPTAKAFSTARSKGVAAAKDAARDQLAAVRDAQQAVIAKLPAQTPVLYRTHAAMSGLGVTTDVSNVAALQAIPGVSAVYPVAPKKPDNAYAVPLQGAPSVWQTTSNQGAGTKVGIIDTGIDFTHANFGGPGTVAAYDAAHAGEATAADPALFGPGAPKVKGGVDLVGDKYNADPTSKDYEPATKPDANPLDCNGHGSHVAGSAAGLGENANGTTYKGPYNTSTPFSSMKIGPGMAPRADLYAIRVFGCDGSTDVTSQAIDWAMDPNGDGDTSDHLDVVNMSLGSDYGNPVDGDTIMANAASKAGVVMAISSGNSYDLYDVGGSPGSAVRAITSAASVDASNVVDTLRVTFGGAQHEYGSSRSIAYDWAKKPDLAGSVVAISPTDTGCAPYSTADAAKVAGKVVLVKWTQEALECGSVARSGNIAAAGGVGFIFANSSETFSAGITGSDTIPGVLVSRSGGEAIRAALATGTVTVDGTVANAFTQTVPGDDDKVTDFSSRGIRTAGNLKPDVAAVGATVSSAAVGTGNDRITESGTSMASPMTAGLAALVHTAHPGWTAEQVKADIMNTAGQDLFIGGSAAGTGGRYAPNRVGAGRIQAVPALANTVLAYVKDDPGAVSVSFGPVEVTGPMTLTKTVTVQNTGTSAATYAASYDAITSVPGVSYVVSPASVAVPAGASTSVSVTFTVTDPKALTKTVDATHGRLDVDGQTPLETLADASGNLLLTPSGSAPQLRVPVYSAPRPAAQMTQAASVGFPAGKDTGTITLAGTGLDQGTGAENITSVAAGLELQAVSDKAPACTTAGQEGCVLTSEDRAADIKYVGTATDDDSVPSGAAVSYIGITAQAPSSTPANKAEFDIYVDADGDGAPDLVGYNTRLPDTEVFVVDWVDLATGKVVDEQLLDNRLGDLDLAVFDSDTALYPISHDLLTAYGYDVATSTRVSYGVMAYSAGSGQLVDAVGFTRDRAFFDPLSFDVEDPGLSVTDADGYAPLFLDQPGDQLTVTKDDATLAADGALGVMMVHFHNRTGSKAQVVTLAQATTTSLTAAPTTVQVGTPTTLTASVAGGSTTTLPTGSVSITDTATGQVVATRTLTSEGQAVITYTPTTASTQRLVATYGGDSTFAGSSSAPVVLTVSPAPGTTPPTTPAPPVIDVDAKLSLRLVPSSGPRGRAFTAKVTTVSAATGKVTFKAGGRKVTVRLVNGKAKASFVPRGAGKVKVKAVYTGDATYAADKDTATYRVR